MPCLWHTEVSTTLLVLHLNLALSSSGVEWHVFLFGVTCLYVLAETVQYYVTRLCWKQCSYILDALNTYRNYTQNTKQPKLQVLTLPNFLIMMWHNKKILLILVLSHFLHPNQSSLGTKSRVGTGLHTSSVTVQLFLSSLTQNAE